MKPEPDDEKPLDLDEPITCWCGTSNAYFADEDDGLDATCGGSGSLECYCGGDQCVCHNHGQIECPGCEDCGFGEPNDDY